MIFSADGMRPDPAKVDVLDFITAPTNKDNLLSFLCVMQSNSDLIENFAQKAARLLELIHIIKILTSDGNQHTNNALKNCYRVLKKIHCLDTLTQKRKYL